MMLQHAAAAAAAPLLTDQQQQQLMQYLLAQHAARSAAAGAGLHPFPGAAPGPGPGAHGQTHAHALPFARALHPLQQQQQQQQQQQHRAPMLMPVAHAQAQARAPLLALPAPAPQLAPDADAPPLPAREAPDDAAMEEFKTDVRTWLELDSTIRRLQAATRERRAAKKQLTDRILQFMNRYNIEDLSTRDGRLRYRVSYVRTPLSHQAIKDRILGYFASNDNVAQAVAGAVFGNRERTERVALSRLKL